MGDLQEEMPQIRVKLAGLVAEHHQVLFGYAFRLTGSTQDAEDLVQQTFLTAREKGHQIRDEQSARSWLFTVLRNIYLKQRRRRRPDLAENLELRLEEFPQDLPTDVWFDPEELQNAIDQLPSDFKIVVLMFYFEECSYKEIAEKLDVPIGTVMSRLSRAKSHLRKHLIKPEQNAVGGMAQ